jgi:glycosyltransferase involved in cell wall biosynthesis
MLGTEGAIWHSDGQSSFSEVAQFSPYSNPFGLLERGIRRIQSTLGLPYFNLFDSRRFAGACLNKLQDVEVYLERCSWTGFGGIVASKFSGRPLVMEYNGDPLHDLDAKGLAPGGFQRWGSVILMTWALRQAARVVATGNGWREQSIKRWKLDPDKTITVENGSSLLNLLDREDLNSFNPFRRRGEPVQVVYLGGFQPWQGLRILVEAFHRLVQEGVQLQLLLIGAGHGVEAIKQELTSRGLSDHVHLTGALSTEKFAPLLAGADIAVAPYCGWSEYAGLKLYDYKAAGLAIVASGENGEPACVDHERSGIIVPPCDVNAMELALSRLSLDAEFRVSLGRQARMEAERFHRWEHTAFKLEKVLHEVGGRVEAVHSTVEAK